MFRSVRVNVCRSCFVKLKIPVQSPFHHQLPSQLSSSTSIKTQNYKSNKPKESNNGSTPSVFRRCRPPPKPIPRLARKKYPISSKVEGIITGYLRVASLYKRNLLSSQQQKKLADHAASLFFTVDKHLGFNGVNPSILFLIFLNEPSRRKQIMSLLSFLSIARPSPRRHQIGIGFALNAAKSLSLNDSAYSLAFQKALKL